MKKLVGLFLVGMVLSVGAQAQKHPGVDVPAAVKTAFAKQYPGTGAQWIKEGDRYEARFKQKRQQLAAVYNADGSLAETELAIKVSQLPLPVVDYMEQHYGGSISEAAKVTKANGEINYEATSKGKEVVFDASCALVEKTP